MADEVTRHGNKITGFYILQPRVTVGFELRTAVSVVLGALLTMLRKRSSYKYQMK